ncbi:hypothetical protein NDU88_003983 [Pleurodeles waltl]|uniref:Uncharacterized protein n=1 Tax=Pleurodeles waltl TaxID=8319 RepID=A0AAV7TQI8_PLEWA|nr:hypothetical protein NDU88_003983 [Pleurodeles waltl]
MGKSNAKQSKVSFEQRHQTRTTDLELEDVWPRLGSSADTTQDPDVCSMFLDLKHSFNKMNTKMNLLMDRIDRLKDKVDKHDKTN